MDKLLCSAAVVSSFCFFLAYSQRLQIFYWMSTTLDVYYTIFYCMSTTWCGLSANLECRSEMCCTRLAEIQDADLSSYIFATKACIDNRKNVVKQQYFLHMSSQYGELSELRLISSWDRLESLVPANFNRFRVTVLASLFLPFDQQRSTEGATYIRLGGHLVGHRPTFYFSLIRKLYVTISLHCTLPVF